MRVDLVRASRVVLRGTPVVITKMAPVSEYFASAPVTIGNSWPILLRTVSGASITMSSSGTATTGRESPRGGTAGTLGETFHPERRQISVTP